MAIQLSVSRVVAEFNKQKTIAEMEQIFGVSAWSITKRLRIAGVGRRGGRTKKIKNEQVIDGIVLAYLCGATLRALADKTFTSKDTIRRIIIVRGLLYKSLPFFPDKSLRPNKLAWSKNEGHENHR